MVLLEAFLFIATGVISTVVGQLLLFSGSGDSWTMLIPLSNYLGMALVSIIPEQYTRITTTASSSSSASLSSASIPATTDESASPTKTMDTHTISTDNTTSTNEYSSLTITGSGSTTTTHPRHRTLHPVGSTTTTTTSTVHHHPTTMTSYGGTHTLNGTSSSTTNSIPGTPLRNQGVCNSTSTSVSSSVILTPSSHRSSPTGTTNHTSNGTIMDTYTNDPLNTHTLPMTDNNDIDILKKQQQISFHQHPVSFIRSLHHKLLSLSLSSSSSSSSSHEVSASSSSFIHPAYSKEDVSSISASSTESSLLSSSSSSSISIHHTTNPKLCGIFVRPFTITTNQYVFSVILLDIFGYYFHILGLRYAGSALFQVIYSSVVIWAAILSRILRGKQSNNQLNTYQILGIFIVLFGLVYSTVAEHIQSSGTNLNPWLAFLFPSTSRYDFVSPSVPSSPSGHEGTATIDIESIGNDKEDSSLSSSSSNPTKRWDILIGMVFSLLSSLTYGTVYALAECLMAQPNPPSPKYVAKYIGYGISLLLFLYVLVFTLPRYNDILVHVHQLNFLSWPMISVCYFIMMLSAAVHSITYYQLMHSLGAIAAGIMQSARAIGVFIIAGIFFCSYQESQCFNYPRGIATLFVIGGILFYSYGKQLHHHHH